jgi:hypothetical protein
MKLNITVHPSGPCMEPELLVKFVMMKCQEVMKQKNNNLAPIWVALALAAVSPDQVFYDRLKEIISSSASAEKILGLFRDVFLPSLNRLEGGQSPEWVDAESEYPPAGERDYRKILLYALREGQKMLDSGTYEWVRIFESLTWIGLQPYYFRLYEFEEARDFFQDDPEKLVRKGMEIIRSTVGLAPRKEK